MTDTTAFHDPAIQTTPIKGISTPAPRELTSLTQDLEVLSEENTRGWPLFRSVNQGADFGYKVDLVI
jgi:hypothetical protein